MSPENDEVNIPAQVCTASETTEESKLKCSAATLITLSKDMNVHSESCNKTERASSTASLSHQAHT